MTAVSGKVMSVAGKVYLSVLNSWDLNNVTINELQLHRRKQSWCTDDIWFGLNEGKPRKFSVNIADFQANTWILEPMDMKSEYTSPHMCMNVCLHIFPRGICYLKKEIFKCWEWEDGESWWQIGINGRTLFDRLKPAVAAVAAAAVAVVVVYMTMAQDGGKFVSHVHRPLLPPGNTPGAHFF